MKIRNGFVSNSSSSSFLIIGKELNIREVSPSIIKKKNIYALSPGTLYEGQDIFRIENTESLAFLKALDDVDSDKSFLIMDSCFFGSDDSGEIDVKNLPDKGKVRFYSGMIDHHSSEYIEDLKSRYDDDGDVTRGMQKYLRAKKINEIEKNYENEN